MKVAVAQLAPGIDPEQNLDGTIAAMRQAAAQGAKLLVLPELCTSPYQLGDESLDRWAEEISTGKSVQQWIREAKSLGMILVAGILERDRNRYYNSAVILGPQGVVGVYRKAHLFSWERRRLAPGNGGFSPVDAGQVRLGVLICYDLRFVEAVRLLALQGIQLLCVPTTWTNVGKPQSYDQNGLCAAAHLALGHAYASRIFVLCAGRIGVERNVRYLGNSLIAGPSGHALAGPAGGEETGVLIAEIDCGQASDKHVGPDNDVLADRRTDLYKLSNKRGFRGPRTEGKSRTGDGRK